jgi:lysophospholipase L1-like esterase
MAQKLRKIICRLLIRNVLLRKVVFFIYYSNCSGAAISARTLKSELKNNINIFRFKGIFIDKKRSHFFNSAAKVETVIYDRKIRGTIAELEKKFTFIPAYNLPLKIMPLGDSITRGIIGNNDRNSGGYRTELWNKFVDDGLKVEFVGSQSNGPDRLSNKHHEGHAGWTIRQIAASVNEWLNASQPDLILLTVGTNDTAKSSLRTMIDELSALIDQITSQSPDVHLLVASIPPIHPTVKPAVRVLRAIYFNAAIPNIVNSKVAQGKKVDFVDMRSLTVNDLTCSLSLDLDNGLHPNAQGYRKIANFWHDAIFKVISNQQTSLTSGCYSRSTRAS